MIKALHSSLCVFVATGVFLSATGTTQAATSVSELAETIYKKSKDGDASDVFVIIGRALEENPQINAKALRKLIKRLKENRDRLARNVSDEDLDKVYQKLRKKLARLSAQRAQGQIPNGPVTPPETPFN